MKNKLLVKINKITRIQNDQIKICEKKKIKVSLKKQTRYVKNNKRSMRIQNDQSQIREKQMVIGKNIKISMNKTIKLNIRKNLIDQLEYIFLK